MAVNDTVENKRSWMTESTLMHLGRTVDWMRHRLIVVDNASCKETMDMYTSMARWLPFTLIQNMSNIGTAKAINRAWKMREPGENALKMDNDVLIYLHGWADMIEDVFRIDPEIGICALKRKGLAEAPWADGDMKSVIRMLPHEHNEKWLIVEEVKSVIGTCQGYSSALLDKIGFLVQPGIYGFDDSLASIRARIAGFKRVFLPSIDIDHIDPGGDAWCQWKREEAARQMPEFNKLVVMYMSGVKDIYYDGQ